MKKANFRLKQIHKSSNTLDCIENIEYKDKDRNCSIECGWGKLIFAHTYDSNKEIIKSLKDEEKGKRNIAIYVKEPQIINMLSKDIFLDPSVTFRLQSFNYMPPKNVHRQFKIRYLSSIKDAQIVNEIYKEYNMIEVEPEVILKNQKSKAIAYYIAEDLEGNIIGTIMGVNHSLLFNDSEKGASFWSLAVTSKTKLRGVGRTLIRYVAEKYFTRGCAYIDLSVMYDNKRAIDLYRKLKFEKVPVFCMKHRNAYNEKILEEYR